MEGLLMGVDGEPMVVVLGGEGAAQREDVDSILEERAKSVVLAIDGMQPDVGHEVLWVIRDCISRNIIS